MNLDLEKEFTAISRIIKYDIMKERMINYYKDLSKIIPSIESAEEKYHKAIKQMTIIQLEKLAENAWQDELEKLNF